jgi:hypothetical protein
MIHPEKLHAAAGATQEFHPVLRKNSIRLPSDRDVGTYLFGLRDLENPGSQLGWQKIPLSLTDPVPS